MPDTAPHPEWTDDLTACAGLVERGDPERFRMVMAAPVPARLVLFPLYAFNLEVARAPWVTQEPMIAEMRLQWWRDAMEEIMKGEGVRRHEVVTPLAARLSGAGAGLLDALIEARRWDVWKEPFEDELHLRRYIDATSGNLLRAGALMVGEPLDEEVAADAGFALGLANWFRAVPALVAAKRYPLPDGRPETVQVLSREALDRIARARRRRRAVPKSAAPLLFGLPEAEGLLRLAAAEPDRVKQGALALSPFAEKVALLRASFMGRW